MRDGAISQITVISGSERRRVWTDQQTREMVAAVSVRGANVEEIARRADVRPNQIYRWRQQIEQAAQGFPEVQVQVQTDPAAAIGWAIALMPLYLLIGAHGRERRCRDNAKLSNSAALPPTTTRQSCRSSASSTSSPYGYGGSLL